VTDGDREKLVPLLPTMRKIPRRVRGLMELVQEARATFADDQVPDWLDKMSSLLERLDLETRDLVQVTDLLEYLVDRAGFETDDLDVP
jgi:hypothetical protein